MKRALIGAVAVVLLIGAILYLRRAPVATQEVASNPNLYENDSLGVGMPLPQSPGWSFRYAPNVPGGGVVMAVHEGEKASVRLYAHAKPPATLQEVVAARRKELASIFQVEDLDQVVEHVIKNDYVQFQGHPAWQWQGVTEAVAVAGEEPQKVMFMLLALEREERIFDIVGILAFPARATPEQQQAVQALSNDLQFVLANLQLR